MKKALVLSVLAAGCALAADLQVISDLQGENVRYRALVGKLSKGEFVALASEFLKSKETTLGAIVAYGSVRDHVLAGPRGGDHCGYDQRLSVIDYNDKQSGCPEVKEAIKIGASIIIRTLDSDCRRSSELIQGSTNPLIFDAGGTKIEILHLSFSRPIGRRNLRRVGADFYIRTQSPVTTDAARSITERIRAMTAVRDLSVDLRSDSWFFNECNFPAQFPFEIQGKVPSREEWYNTRYASCSVWAQWPIQCFESASRP